MKRAVIALVIGAFAFVAVALAAGLTVNDSSLGAGSGNATSCDSAVGTSYVGDTTFSGGNYVVLTTTVTGVNETTCASKTLDVTLTNGSNSVIGTGSVVLPSGGTSVSVNVPVTGAPTAASVLHTAVLIG